MKVYYGNKGSEFYIMCVDFQEIYVFDMFGNLSSVNGLVSSCDNWQEVDFFSYVGVSLKECEVLYNGYKTKLDIPLFNAIKPLRDKGGYLGTLFNVPHEDDIGRYNQILLLYPKGTISNKFVVNLYPNKTWSKLK